MTSGAPEDGRLERGRKSGETIAGLALAYVQEPATRRVRVEDDLTALGSITGEAALRSAGVLDVETTELIPGSAIFGDQINDVLTGPDPEDDIPASQRYLPCAMGLATALRQVQGAIDPGIALRLALEVVFGMAKMVPMSKRRFEEAKSTGGGR